MTIPRRRVQPRAVAAVTAAALLAGCGYQAAGTQRAQPAPPGPPAAALSASAGCAQAAPVVADARGVLQRLALGSVTAGQASRLLGGDQAALGKVARVTIEPVLQANLAEAFDAFAAYRAVMVNPDAPAYQQTLASLAGTLAGFGRVCAVGTPGAATRPGGWTAATVTLKGSEEVGLWAHAVSGAPVLTLRVTEVSGGSVVGGQQVTMRLGRAPSFATLTYRVRHPGASSLRVSVSTTGAAPGETFVAGDVTVVRG